MDVGTASALSLYNYQNAFNLSSQTAANSGTSGTSSAGNPAVLQALISTYAGMTSASDALLPSSDGLSALAGEGVMATLMGGIYSQSANDGNTTFTLNALTSTLNSASNSSLLASLGSSLEGFSANAVSTNATLALQAYAEQQAGLSGTLTDDAKAAAQAVNSSNSTDIEAAVQAAQAGILTDTMDLFA